MFTPHSAPSRGCFHDTAQLMRRRILCSHPMGSSASGVMPANMAHLLHPRLMRKPARRHISSLNSENNETQLKSEESNSTLNNVELFLSLPTLA